MNWRGAVSMLRECWARVSVLADLFTRALLLVHAYFWLRRAPSAKLWAIDSPAEFAVRVLPAAGRHLALAVALLPRALRRQCRIAYLLARALDAFEDLSPDPGSAEAALRAARAFLRGETQLPPSTHSLMAQRSCDRVELLLAARLPLLRREAEALAPDVRARVLSLLDRLGEGMEASCATLARGGEPLARVAYADSVLGRAVSYAVALAAPEQRLPRDGCRAIARALQFANDLRDFDFDHGRAPRCQEPTVSRLSLLLSLIPELPLAAHLLGWLPFRRRSGVRAATALLVLTTARFFAKRGSGTQEGSARLPVCLRRPLLHALLCGWSHAAYQRSLVAIEEALMSSLRWGRPARAPVPAGAAGDGHERGPAAASPASAQAFELALARRHPCPEAGEALASVSILLERARDLVEGLPSTALHAAPCPQIATRLMIADQILASAFERMARLGAGPTQRFARTVVELAGERGAAGTAPWGEVMLAFLAREANHAQVPQSVPGERSRRQPGSAAGLGIRAVQPSTALAPAAAGGQE